MTFKNRGDAGEQLARKLVKHHSIPDPIVIGLPRGGIPVAAELARSLDADLDTLATRSLTLPSRPDVTIGAIAAGGACVIDDSALTSFELSEPELHSIIRSGESALLQGEQRSCRAQSPLHIEDRHVIVVDDGLITGVTMTAAILALRQLNPRRILAALPVASMDALLRVAKEADEILCLRLPENLFSIAQWYEDFQEVDADEVQRLLDSSRPPVSDWRQQLRHTATMAGNYIGELTLDIQYKPKPH